MTVYDFAFLPKRCDKCGRRFVLERYEHFYRLVGLEQHTLKCYKCSKCAGIGRNSSPNTAQTEPEEADGVV